MFFGRCRLVCVGGISRSMEPDAVDWADDAFAMSASPSAKKNL